MAWLGCVCNECEQNKGKYLGSSTFGIVNPREGVERPQLHPPRTQLLSGITCRKTQTSTGGRTLTDQHWWWDPHRPALMVGPSQTSTGGGTLTDQHWWWDPHRPALVVGPSQTSTGGGTLTDQHWWWDPHRPALVVGPSQTSTGGGTLTQTRLRCAHR